VEPSLTVAESFKAEVKAPDIRKLKGHGGESMAWHPTNAGRQGKKLISLILEQVAGRNNPREGPRNGGSTAWNYNKLG